MCLIFVCVLVGKRFSSHLPWLGGRLVRQVDSCVGSGVEGWCYLCIYDYYRRWIQTVKVSRWCVVVLLSFTLLPRHPIMIMSFLFKTHLLSTAG